MSLSPEAYAVIEGRHSDPFHYLGWHPHGETPIVIGSAPVAALETSTEAATTAAATTRRFTCWTNATSLFLVNIS